jgi:hypothetical protein
MIDIESLDTLPLATEFNLTDLIIKVNRGGGLPVLEKAEYSLLASAIAIAATSVNAPAVRKISQTVLASEFTDGGGAAGTKALTTQIPAGAVFLYSVGTVNVAFSGDTTAVVMLGDGSDVDRYNTGTPSVLTTGAKELGAPSGNRFHPAAATVTVTITGGLDFGAVNPLGSLTVDLYYLATV